MLSCAQKLTLNQFTLPHTAKEAKNREIKNKQKTTVLRFYFTRVRYHDNQKQVINKSLNEKLRLNIKHITY